MNSSRDASEQAGAPRDLVIARGKAKALVVDDTVANQEIIQYLLESAGVACDVANDGQEGLRMVESASMAGAQYDVVLMDMRMPVMNGYDATRAIRKRGHMVPIVALTAYSLGSIEEECLDCGCDVYLTKPIQPERLFETLETLIGQSAETGADRDLASRAKHDPGFERVKDRFMASLETSLATVESGDRESVYDVSHTLKGTAASFGWPEIGEEAARLGDSIQQGDECDVSRLRALIRDALERWRSERDRACS